LRAKIATLFPPEQADVVEQRLLTECGETVPMISVQGETGIERVRAAVLKLSEGSLERLDHAIYRARRDWRDVLMWSGFAHEVLKYREWLSETGGQAGGA
jgi:hypothetical protein